MKKFFAKLFKIIGLYLLFGFILVFAFSVGGGYEGMVIKQGLGPVSNLGYIGLMLWCAVLWLPGLYMFTVSPMKYWSIPYYRIIFGAIITLFIIISIRIILKKKKGRVD